MMSKKQSPSKTYTTILKQDNDEKHIFNYVIIMQTQVTQIVWFCFSISDNADVALVNFYADW